MNKENSDWFTVEKWKSCVYDADYKPNITTESMGPNILVHKVNFNTNIKFTDVLQCSKFEFKTGSCKECLWTVKCYLHKSLYNCIAFGLVSPPNVSVNTCLSFSTTLGAKLTTLNQTFLNGEKWTTGRHISQSDVGGDLYLSFELNVYEDINEISFYGSYNNNIISNKFKQFLSKDFDVTIRGDGFQFKAHRDILYDFSIVFQNMFSCDMSEANSGEIKITDFSSEAIFAMLQYFYTGKINKLNNVCDELLKLSHKYEIEDLQHICLSFIYLNLSVENVIKYFTIADVYDFFELKEKCTELLNESRNIEELVKREDWSKIVAKPEHKSLLCFLFRNFNKIF